MKKNLISSASFPAGRKGLLLFLFLLHLYSWIFLHEKKRFEIDLWRHDLPDTESRPSWKGSFRNWRRDGSRAIVGITKAKMLEAASTCHTLVSISYCTHNGGADGGWTLWIDLLGDYVQSGNLTILFISLFSRIGTLPGIEQVPIKWLNPHWLFSYRQTAIFSWYNIWKCS